MIIGAHSIIYSKSPEADPALMRELFEPPNLEVGVGWLHFGITLHTLHPRRLN